MSGPTALRGEHDRQWSSNGPSDRRSITTNTLVASQPEYCEHGCNHTFGAVCGLAKPPVDAVLGTEEKDGNT